MFTKKLLAALAGAALLAGGGGMAYAAVIDTPQSGETAQSGGETAQSGGQASLLTEETPQTQTEDLTEAAESAGSIEPFDPQNPEPWDFGRLEVKVGPSLSWAAPGWSGSGIDSVEFRGTGTVVDYTEAPSRRVYWAMRHLTQDSKDTTIGERLSVRSNGIPGGDWVVSMLTTEDFPTSTALAWADIMHGSTFQVEWMQVGRVDAEDGTVSYYPIVDETTDGVRGVVDVETTVNGWCIDGGGFMPGTWVGGQSDFGQVCLYDDAEKTEDYSITFELATEKWLSDSDHEYCAENPEECEATRSHTLAYRLVDSKEDKLGYMDEVLPGKDGWIFVDVDRDETKTVEIPVPGPGTYFVEQVAPSCNADRTHCSVGGVPVLDGDDATSCAVASTITEVVVTEDPACTPTEEITPPAKPTPTTPQTLAKTGAAAVAALGLSGAAAGAAGAFAILRNRKGLVG